MNAEFDETAIRALCDAYKDIQTRYRDELTIDELWKAMHHDTRKELVLLYWYENCDSVNDQQTEKLVKAAIKRGDAAEAGNIIYRAALREEPSTRAYMNSDEIMGAAYRRFYQEAA